MGFLIASDDGRCRICVMTADAAAIHITKLQKAGTTFSITDARGNPRDLSELDALDRQAPTVFQI